MNDERKGQLSIFIIVAVIVLFLLALLIFFSFSEQGDELEGSRTALDLGDDDLTPIKGHVDQCLEKQLKRGLVIAGLKGGFIYNRGEFYGPSVIPDDTYTNEFITNQNLNWNNLLFNTLIHSQAQVYSPQLETDLSFQTEEGEVVIYDHSIREDIEEFITDEFLECIDLEQLAEEGFIVDFDQYAGSVVSFDQSTGLVRMRGLKGELGDTLHLRTQSKTVSGQILNFEDDIVVGAFSPQDLQGIAFEEELSNVIVLNIDSQISSEVIFKEQEVSARLIFPVTIVGNAGISSLGEVFVTVPVQFVELLNLAQVLANEKYKDKSLDYDSEEDILSVLNKHYTSSDDFLNSVRFVKTKVNDSETYKMYVYSLVDEQSLILGHPFVFNFGYENEAPEIDLSSIRDEDLLEENVLVLTSPNTLVEMDLKPLTSDNQIRDNYVSYYIEQQYSGADAEFSLDSNGIVSFIGYEEKRYTYTISVTDRETVRSHDFVFVTGLPDNTDNRLASQCFEYDSFHIPTLFPVAQEFRDELFTYQTGDYNNVYAYGLYVSGNPTLQYGASPPTVTFRPSCLYAPSLFEADVELRNNQGTLIPVAYDDQTGRITLPILDEILELTVTVRDKSTSSIATEPYVMKVYPASCLGPHADQDQFNQALFGGDRSCCDTTPLLNAIAANNPKAFVNSNSVLETSGFSLDAEAYFCFDIMELYSSSHIGAYSFAHTSDVVWDSIGSQATSLFEGRMRAVCDGSSASGTLTDVTGGNDLVGTTTSVDYFGTSQQTNLNFNLKLVEQASPCEFCYIETRAPFTLHAGPDYLLFSGFKSVNQFPGSHGVTPLLYSYGTTSFDHVFVKCDEQWYTSTSGSYSASAWSPTFDGSSGVPAPLFKSQGYCYQGSTTCSGRPHSPSYDLRIDNQPQVCTDWYVDSDGSYEQQPNTGWVCGQNQLCDNGVCV